MAWFPLPEIARLWPSSREQRRRRDPTETVVEALSGLGSAQHVGLEPSISDRSYTSPPSSRLTPAGLSAFERRHLVLDAAEQCSDGWHLDRHGNSHSSDRRPA